MVVVKRTYYLDEDLDMALKLRAVKIPPTASRCVKIPLVWNAPTCDRCGHPEVEIIQAEGEFCSSCWAERTEPYVTP